MNMMRWCTGNVGCGTITTHLSKAASAFGFIAHKGTLARMQAPMIIKICDLSEGLATVDALIWPIVCVDALMVPQIGRLREAYKEEEFYIPPWHDDPWCERYSVAPSAPQLE